MTTKPSILLKDDSKCRNVSSTEGLDILCTAIELESESSIKTTTYCTLIINECSSDNNIINNAAKCLKVDKVKNIGRKLCSREGCLIVFLLRSVNLRINLAIPRKRGDRAANF